MNTYNLLIYFLWQPLLQSYQLSCIDVKFGLLFTWKLLVKCFGCVYLTLPTLRMKQLTLRLTFHSGFIWCSTSWVKRIFSAICGHLKLFVVFGNGNYNLPRNCTNWERHLLSKLNSAQKVLISEWENMQGEVWGCDGFPYTRMWNTSHPHAPLCIMRRLEHSGTSKKFSCPNNTLRISTQTARS
jgi:hypothetical protein